MSLTHTRRGKKVFNWFTAVEDPTRSDDTADQAPYRRLWLSVILRARKDADGLDLMFDNKEESLNIKREGRQWLVGETMWRAENVWDLERVCEWAGVSMEALREMARRKYYDDGTKEGGGQ